MAQISYMPLPISCCFWPGTKVLNGQTR